ncbi:glutamine amidotransferase [Candidatus Beckwithbacteria bacterium CG10_big_fil_rev_8_21_14_0_10_34_10]|uniref:Lipid II isoglutaminyl synthase (glutamine-hydrolyzing) subunit GatD n=1 Tax=Candidatus Beckwithbacteria bacterium CG10_big_fil_rev_8_21_14_0_10_34_10 TaxID=1974495 RepID=A0A2H0WAF5_9BACT|nr:MAG: glutamine amidotransferase [Candidatus Beckwithbacteria bacterium CG10_big_fil_rev_8_21_14_0_10_34_10]
MKIKIGHLYPDLLNIYGDRGNIICLKKRCLLRNIKVEVISVSPGDSIKEKEFDLFFGGGGQDRQQEIVANDLQKKGGILKAEAKRGVPMLTICGTYQLFGHYFKTHDGKKIPGISLFDLKTIASFKRKIGNIRININKKAINIDQNISKKLVGFENHSGNTYITNISQQKEKNKTFTLGKVEKGFGNNGEDKTEGAVFKNVIGCYLHGPVLPKNPHLADFLIKKALEIKYGNKIKLKELDDNLEWLTHRKALRFK